MWNEGIITNPITGEDFKYWVKHFEEGSEFGIDGGRISKLTIRKVGENLNRVNYDRGWDKTPTEETQDVYNVILDLYN
jgi:hypothetical protein